MRIARGVLAVALNVAVTTSVLSACGGSDGPAATSGLPVDRKLNALTDADRKTLCNWAASLFGGYGKSRPCSERVSWPGPQNEMACVAQVSMARSGCTSTVSTYEECYTSFFKAATSCDMFPPACAQLSACYSAG